MRLSIVTPTCDRPVGLALAERWLRAQTRQHDEWIIADGGQHRAVVSLPRRHLHAPRPPGAANFRANLARGLEAATGDVIVFVEDDDYYAPTHLARLVAALERQPAAGAVGDDRQRYYYLPRRQWRVFQNRGASLCQTAIRRAWVPAALEAIAAAGRTGTGYGVDGALWARIPPAAQALERMDTVIGIKGIPGRAGLGIGHRPRGPGWQSDRDGARLRGWIGPDADVYLAGSLDHADRTV